MYVSGPTELVDIVGEGGRKKKNLWGPICCAMSRDCQSQKWKKVMKIDSHRDVDISDP